METVEIEDIAVIREPVEVEQVELKLEDELCCVLEPETQETELRQEPVVAMVDVTKLSYELQQAYRVYVELLGDSHNNVTWPFIEPVDVDSLGLWDYHDRIKDPMCFSTIGTKFSDNIYTSITEVVVDLRLMLENCYRYNGPDHWVSKLGQKLENILEQKLALLNRSLRDKVTLAATVALKSDYPIVIEIEGSSRRRSGRQNYLQMLNGKNSSSLVNQLKIQEEGEEKERRRLREKEKKEANQVLLQDLAEWEKEQLTPDTMEQLHSMWEVPSVGSMLYLVRNVLNIEDLNVTEFELSFVYPNKSTLLGRIFTALLITPHQRKSLYKKPPMKFKMWESKLKDKVSVWFKLAEKEGSHSACLQYGIDPTFFDVLGHEKNPLEDKSYIDLTLHQRVWLLKALCDMCLHKDYDIREHVITADFMEQRELFLGVDTETHSYLYFPVFQTTDVRIYKHFPLPVPNTRKKKEPTRPATPPPQTKRTRKTPTKPCTPSRTPRDLRLRQLRNSPAQDIDSEPESPARPSTPSKEPEPITDCTVQDGFHLACHDIETLRMLCEKFAEPPSPPKKRGRKPRFPPPRKRCEVDLHETFVALLQELEKYEGTFSRTCSKAKIKIMKESLEPEAVDEPEQVPETGEEDWGSEASGEDDGAKLDSSDEEYQINDDEESNGKKNKIPRKRKGELQDNKQATDSEIGCAVAIQTVPPRNKKRRKTPNGEDTGVTQDGCSIAIQTPPAKMKKRPKRWSPPKGEASGVPMLTSGPPTSVLISPVSAEESVRATSDAARDVVQTLGVTAVGPREGVNEPMAVAATSLPVSLKPVLVDKTVAMVSGFSVPQSISVTKSHTLSNVLLAPSSHKPTIQTALVMKTSSGGQQPVIMATASSQAQQSSGCQATQVRRKRILVSPEGRAHEVKPFFTNASLQSPATAQSWTTMASKSVGIKSRSVVGSTTASVKPVVAAGRVEAVRTQSSTIIIQGGKPVAVTADPVVTQGKPRVAPGAAAPRPNILSHSRKQIFVAGRPVTVVSGSKSVASSSTVGASSNVAGAMQGKSTTVLLQPKMVPVSISVSQPGSRTVPTQARSHNHTYALPSASVTGSQNNSTTTGVRMVVSASKPTAVQGSTNTASVVPSTIPRALVMPGQSGIKIKTNPLIQPGTKVIPVAAARSQLTNAGAKFVAIPDQSLHSSTAPPQTKGFPVSLVQIQAAAKVVTSRAHHNSPTASVLPKALVMSKATKTTTTQSQQTKIIVIPASSVGPNSPLAGLTPTTIATSSGKSILGYAMVVPIGTPAGNVIIKSVGAAAAAANVRPSVCSSAAKPVPTSSQSTGFSTTASVTSLLKGLATSVGTSRANPCMSADTLEKTNYTQSSTKKLVNLTASTSAVLSAGTVSTTVATATGQKRTDESKVQDSLPRETMPISTTDSVANLGSSVLPPQTKNSNSSTDIASVVSSKGESCYEVKPRNTTVRKGTDRCLSLDSEKVGALKVPGDECTSLKIQEVKRDNGVAQNLDTFRSLEKEIQHVHSEKKLTSPAKLLKTGEEMTVRLCNGVTVPHTANNVGSFHCVEIVKPNDIEKADDVEMDSPGEMAINGTANYAGDGEKPGTHVDVSNDIPDSRT